MKLNCIVVDDNPVFRMMLKELIQKDEERLSLVGTAESAEEALEIINKKHVDLVFLDLGLPGMDGFEFIEALENPDEIQIILVTGYSEYALDAFEYNVVDYLVKPLTNERFKQAISKAVRNRSEVKKAEKRENILFSKLARFMYTRQMSYLEPVPLRTAKLGYVYPMVSANFNFDYEQDALDILKEAEDEGLLHGEFVDSTYVCNTCYNSQLQYRETCPNCKSSNLQAEDLVHHFECAYMGPISDFYKKSTSNNLVCPKCEKTLDHIGVDYDKPSVIYNCLKCDEDFQKPVIKAKCHNCNSDTKVEYLIKKKLKRYQLTHAGNQVAEGKYEADLEGFGILDDIMDEGYLLRFLRKSIQRKKETKEPSCLADLDFVNISDLYGQIGEERANELLREMYQVISKEIPVTDEVVFPNKMKARLLITDKDIKEAKSLLKDVSATIHELIADNFDGFKINISITIQAVEKGKSENDQIENLNAMSV